MISVLRALATETAPDPVSSADAAAMRRHLLGRAARLALTIERPAQAAELIQQGLALAGHDPFRSQLLVLAVEAQRARGLDATAAEQETRDALAQ